MTPPKAGLPPSSLPEELRTLATELAKLPRDTREMVISAARAANTAGQGYPTISWASLMSAKGIVSFGGNAVEDTDAAANRRLPHFGAAKGLLHVHDDFDEPLEDFGPYTE
jgi:hypothetical protein